MTNENKEIIRSEGSVQHEMMELKSISSLIYIVRRKQVMLDSDLAILYQVETKNLNKAMKRNITRFPEDFCFQLSEAEYTDLRFQFGTSSLSATENTHGGRRTLPYVFTEQGISMLSSVLRSEVAVNVSIGIMRTFVEMRKYMSNTSLIYTRLSDIETKQNMYQIETSEKFEQVFRYISDHEESQQKIFYDGQIYDAFRLITNIISEAEKSIILIDNYVDVGTLNILAKKNKDVDVMIYTARKTRLSDKDIDTFNMQYPKLEVRYTGVFHDRFLIVDNEKAYHIGASLKDAGKKCFAISVLNDKGIIRDIVQRLRIEAEED